MVIIIHVKDPTLGPSLYLQHIPLPALLLGRLMLIETHTFLWVQFAALVGI